METLPDFNNRLTNADTGVLTLLGFGPELSDIISRNLLRMSAYWKQQVTTVDIASLFPPVDHVMITNGLYVKGDIVNVVGMLYICLVTGTTNDPTDGTDDWLVLLRGTL